MSWRKKSLKSCRLYVIIDNEVVKGKAVLSLAARLKRLDVDIIQYRDKLSSSREFLKNAAGLKKIFEATDKILIINDRPDIAAITGADGVHIGQEDLPVNSARKLIGKPGIVGVSCHSIAQALKAQREGADYIGVGPVFLTQTKPGVRPVGVELVRRCQSKIKIPFFAIGGISRSSIRSLSPFFSPLRVAVCRDICLSRDLPAAIDEFRRLL